MPLWPLSKLTVADDIVLCIASKAVRAYIYAVLLLACTPPLTSSNFVTFNGRPPMSLVTAAELGSPLGQGRGVRGLARLGLLTSQAPHLANPLACRGAEPE